MAAVNARMHYSGCRIFEHQTPGAGYRTLLQSSSLVEYEMGQLTNRFSGPKLALLAPAAERWRSPHSRSDPVAWTSAVVGIVGAIASGIPRGIGMHLSALGLMLALLAGPLLAEAQPPGKVWRIGQLRTSGSTADLDPFRQRLGELGYVEGQNLIIEYRNAEGRAERLSVLAAELVRRKVDVIVTIGTQAALTAKQATTVIPIVMASSGDAVGTGLVQSLARPGGNVTGMTGISPELSGKRLELVKEAFPKKSQLAVLWNPANPLGILEHKETVAAARTQGLMLQWLEAGTPEEIDAGFAAAKKARADVIIVFPDPVFLTARARIVGLAAKHRLPAMYVFREHTLAGGLMSYGPSIPDTFRRAATYVDKILKGAKPADLPIEQPTKFDLVINLKTAEALGLTIPPSLLLRADHIIE
jgi:putative ABC transport system substrate-binding protein